MFRTKIISFFILFTSPILAGEIFVGSSTQDAMTGVSVPVFHKPKIGVDFALQVSGSYGYFDHLNSGGITGIASKKVGSSSLFLKQGFLKFNTDVSRVFYHTAIGYEFKVAQNFKIGTWLDYGKITDPDFFGEKEVLCFTPVLEYTPWNMKVTLSSLYITGNKSLIRHFHGWHGFTGF